LPIVDTGILTSGSGDPVDLVAGAADPQLSHPPHAPEGLPRFKVRGPSAKTAYTMLASSAPPTRISSSKPCITARL
jgi:hypothetical protein